MGFQSAPVPKDKRYLDGVTVWGGILEFQSAPVPKDKRYLGVA